MKNESGLNPVEFNVLILPEAVEEKTAGGLIKPQDAVEREKHQGARGRIVALSPMAFNADVWPQDMPRPEPGAGVILAKHAGVFIKGDDDVEYRMVKDRDVLAVTA